MASVVSSFFRKSAKSSKSRADDDASKRTTAHSTVRRHASDSAIRKATLHHRLTMRQVLHVGHRLAILGCAVLYLVFEFSAVRDTFFLLNGHINPRTELPADTFQTMCSYCGNSTITDSPLVVTHLRNHKTALPGTIYLGASAISYTMCDEVPDHKKTMYSNAYLRKLFRAITIGIGYDEPAYGNASLDLIAPVIDCYDTTLSSEHANRGRFNFLVRRRNETDKVFILLLSLSTQSYLIPSTGQRGPAGVGVLRFFDDMQAETVWNRQIVSRGFPYDKLDFRAYTFINTSNTGLWTLRSIPRDEKEETVYLQTAHRIGFFYKAESEQSNINYETRLFEQNPCLILTRWRWASQPVLKDAWAWVHFIHLMFGLSTLTNMCILFLATYRNLRHRKIWIGDAFVSISSQVMSRGALVVLSWYMNNLWSLREFGQHDGRIRANLERVLIYEAPIRADLLTLFFSISAIVGLVLRERIDPLFTTVCFLVGYEKRLAIGTWLSANTQTYLKDVAYKFFVDGESGPVNTIVSPMRIWTYHELPPLNPKYLVLNVIPILIMLAPVLAYGLAIKIYRVFRPQKLLVKHSRNTAPVSEDADSLIGNKRILTLFEIATGAELENRFGLLCEYDRNIFIKGMKYASADGIYSNGFVIANKKYLVQTRDVGGILLMKILRKRFRNIYVYELDGHTVHQTARLVYPDTFSFPDLIQLNVQILS